MLSDFKTLLQTPVFNEGFAGVFVWMALPSGLSLHCTVRRRPGAGIMTFLGLAKQEHLQH